MRITALGFRFMPFFPALSNFTLRLSVLFNINASPPPDIYKAWIVSTESYIRTFEYLLGDILYQCCCLWPQVSESSIVSPLLVNNRTGTCSFRNLNQIFDNLGTNAHHGILIMERESRWHPHQHDCRCYTLNPHYQQNRNWNVWSDTYIKHLVGTIKKSITV